MKRFGAFIGTALFFGIVFALWPSLGAVFGFPHAIVTRGHSTFPTSPGWIVGESRDCLAAEEDPSVLLHCYQSRDETLRVMAVTFHGSLAKPRPGRVDLWQCTRGAARFDCTLAGTAPPYSPPPLR